MDPRAIAIIKSLQPFSGLARFHPLEHPLWQLHSLVGHDKHRTLTLTAQTRTLHWTGLPDGVLAKPANLLHEDDPTTVVTLIPGSNPEWYAEVEFLATSDICFAPTGPLDSGEVVVPTLRNIEGHIRREVIPRLKPFLT